MPRPTDAKTPLVAAIERLHLTNQMIKTTAELLRIQKLLTAIGETKPSAPTKPAS